MEAQIEINEDFIKTKDTFKSSNGGIFLMTPPFDENYWIIRIPLSTKQIVVCFPKFSTVVYYSY
jgi:hypothetical protein